MSNYLNAWEAEIWTILEKEGKKEYRPNSNRLHIFLLDRKIGEKSDFVVGIVVGMKKGLSGGDR